MAKNICGIQQIGVGVTDAKKAWKWYRDQFGMDINVFEDTAVAKLMLPHTDGETRERYAALAINLEGGGGFEIWEHTAMDSQHPDFGVKLGDTGIFVSKIKSRQIENAYNLHKKRGLNVLGELHTDPSGTRHYFIKDPYNNIFQVVEEIVFYKKQKSVTGGNYGAIIGVSDIDKAMLVYADILGYNEIVYDKTGVFPDLKDLAGGEETYRRVLLKHKDPRVGPFSKLFGPTKIEIIQAIDREPHKIYKNRIWGELGFIHLCFDIMGMDDLRKECSDKGFKFTVDSAESFDMGVAAGHFSYIEDPDGTLIEFVETHKLPIIAKLGWYMNLKGRPHHKSLPNWMINTMSFNRIKD